MRGNNIKEKKVVSLIFTTFWIRSYLNKLDWLTPQDIYYLASVVYFADPVGQISVHFISAPDLDYL